MDFSKKFKALAAGMATTGALLLAGPAHADYITSSLPGDSPVQFKYNDLETVVSEVGQQLSGIFTISSIGDPSGTPIYWASGLGGSGEINGYFSGLTVAEILPSTGGFNIYFTGGSLSMFSVAAGSYNPTSPLNPIDPQICGGACGPAWLTADFAAGAGVDLGNGGFDESTATLIATVSSLTTPLTGTGDGKLELTGGTAATSFLDGPGPDFSIQSNLQSCPTADPQFSANCNKAGDWPVASFDPVIGQTVPEPGTLFLMGAGLAALGFGASRRKRKTAA